MRKIKNIVIGLFAVMMLVGVPLAGLAAGSVATAQAPRETVCTAIGSGANCGGNRGGNISGIVTAVVRVLSVIVGALAIIMIIFAGFKYTTAGGDSNKLASAKNTLIFALVGLVIAALAQVIVHFVLTKLKGVA